MGSFASFGRGAVVAACGLLVVVSGCNISDPEAGFHLLAPRSLSFDGPQVTIPLRMSGGRPFVEVMINGTGPYLFLIDTGCQSTTISASLAERLSLPRSQFVEVKSPGRKEPEPAIRVRELRIGRAVFRDLFVEGWDLPETLDPKDGILGLNAFVHCQVKLDFPNRQITLLRERLSQQADNKTRFAIGQAFCSIVRVDFEDDGNTMRSWPFRVDTGSDGYFDLPGNVRERPFEVLAEQSTISHDLYGSFEATRMRVKGRASIGQYGITPVIVSMYVRPSENPHDPNVGTVGMRILEHFVLTLDVRTKIMTIEFAKARSDSPTGQTTTAPGGPSGANQQ